MVPGFNWDALINRQLPTLYKPRLPDITREIQAALKINKDIDEVITKQELLYDGSPSKRRPNNVTDIWDHDF